MKNEKLKAIKEELEEKSIDEKTLSAIKDVGKEIKELKAIEKKKKEPKEVSVSNFPKQRKRIEVINFPKQEKIEFPKEIKVSNFPKAPKIPDKISIKKPKWYKVPTFEKHIDKLIGFIKKSILKVDVLNREPDEAISVRLVDKEGKKFIDGVTANIQGPWGSGGESSFSGVSPATTISEYNITMTNADTEYSQALPTNTKIIQFQCRGDYDVRYAFTTGKVATPTAPYFTLKAGCTAQEDSISLSGKTIYFACSTAAQVIELLVFT